MELLGQKAVSFFACASPVLPTPFIEEAIFIPLYAPAFFVDPTIPLLGIYPKNPETPIQKNLSTPMFVGVLLYKAKCWKQ